MMDQHVHDWAAASLYHLTPSEGRPRCRVPAVPRGSGIGRSRGNGWAVLRGLRGDLALDVVGASSIARTGVDAKHRPSMGQ